MGKKLPKSPSELWKVKKTFMTPAELREQMRQVVDAQKKMLSDQQPKVKTPNGKTMRDFRGK